MRRKGSVSRLLIPLAWLLWALSPLAAAFVGAQVQEGWMVQEDRPLLLWAIATGVVWALPFLLILGRLRSTPFANLKWQTAIGLVGLGAIAGLMGGQLVADTLNCAFDDSPAEEVTVKEVAIIHHSVRFRVTSGEHAGLTFTTNMGHWHRKDPATARLRRGRLGVFWCEFSP